jgi:murein DD-endopeptidase MepM/ murein hydrolase activator NlpD
MGRGGNSVMVLGPKWRIHYYAHLDEIHTKKFLFVRKGEAIGTVGNTGNAAGKPPHLHYSVITVIPYPWKMDSSPQGWKKIFYLNPVEELEKK